MADASSVGPFVVLTGAGVSAESGLATFRDAGGLWEGHRVHDVATPSAFARDPVLVHRFYNERRARLRDPAIAPNPAHLALAELERRWPGEFLLVTQNVDDLHERAGGCRLVHIHGELMRALCRACGVSARWEGDLGVDSVCPSCAAAGQLRPDIVWFGEMPYRLDEVYGALERCGTFVAIGTSGVVYPAAGFVAAARGARTIEINFEPSAVSSAFAERRHGPAAKIVPSLVRELLR
ncbi:MAG: NAD-dependent deacylase [Geminicoccaceae bacterium]